MEISVKELAGKLRNGEAVVETLEAKGDAAVRELVAMLKKENDEDTVNASFALEALTMHRSRPGADEERKKLAACLASCLKDCCADEVAKCVVIKAIQLCGGDAEVPALAEQLAEPHVRDYAIMALTAIGTENAKKALLEAAEYAESDVALEYVTAFATLKMKEAATLLTYLWRKADAFHRVNIMDALAEIGDEFSFGGMLDALDSPSETEKAGARAAISKLVRNLENREFAEEIARQYDTHEPGEASIAVMLDSVKDRRTIMPRIMQEIAHGDYVRREAMLTLLLGYADDSIVTDLIELAQQSSAEVLASIIRNLGRRGDRRALQFVAMQLWHKDAGVRAAVLEALSQLDEDVFSTSIMETLHAGNQEDAEMIRTAMAPLAEAGFPERVSNLVPCTKGAMKSVILDYLAARGYKEGRAKVLDSLADSTDCVRISALKALAVLGIADDIDAMLPALSSTVADEVAAAQGTMVALGKADENGVAKLLSALDAGDASRKVALLPVLAKIGGKTALGGVEANLGATDAAVARAAMEALAAWPDACAAKTLRASVESASGDLRETLLKGLFRVCALTEGCAAADCVSGLVAANDLCRSDDERKWLLEAIGDVRCEEAVEQLILPALADDALQDVACVAAVKMICSRGGKDAGLNGDASRKALEAVVAKTADEELRKKAEAQLHEMLTAEGAEERKMRAAYAF